jgi:drug/metabolite transporter (DMT)-like permease
MLDMLSSLLAAVGGLIVFAGAYYIHQKVRLTRFACVMAAVGGFVTLAGGLGGWVNRYAAQLGIIAVVGVIVGIAIIVADVKGKKKGADRPALFAFFLVPIFFLSGLAALPALTSDLQDGVRETTTNMQRMG